MRPEEISALRQEVYALRSRLVRVLSEARWLRARSEARLAAIREWPVLDAAEPS